ncbi:MAG: GTP-binding protein [Candidatus Lokiarchaeota archaeon]|nr:GTP-binding protein [Candidatus Lokiarchaeota archaeon]
MNQLKAVIMGEGGVGKSTLLSLLQGKQMSEKRSPTIGVNVEKVYVGENQVAVWDFGGQRRFQFMWDDFIRGTGITVIVTDSSEKNVEETRMIMKQYERKLGSKVIAIANKQDLPDRLPPDKVAEKLGVPTYGMVAVDNRNFKSLYNILSKHIE